MIWGLLGALGAAVCYGGASILQALAARQERTAEGLDPRSKATGAGGGGVPPIGSLGGGRASGPGRHGRRPMRGLQGAARAAAVPGHGGGDSRAGGCRAESHAWESMGV